MKDKKGIGFQFAWNGIKEAVKLENNFRIHLFFSVVIIIFGIIFKLTTIEWLFLIVAIQLVLVTELINSIFERILDYLSLQYSPQIKVMKDMSASVVLVSAICAVLIGLIIFIPKILAFI